MRLMTWVVETPDLKVMDTVMDRINSVSKTLGWERAVVRETNNTYSVDIEAFAELASILPNIPTTQQYEQLTLF